MMNRRLWLVAVGMSALVAACKPTYPKCENDEHCTEKGEVCVQGMCRECATDANCKAGFVCDMNKCVPKPECTDDGQCGTGSKCSHGKCMVDPNFKKPGTCAVNDDCPSGQECVAGTCAVKTAKVCTYEPIHFDFNESKLTIEGQQMLATLAECIKKEGVKLRLEGHADDRGTEEYNLQLSNRRAESVKKYLVTLGVKDGDLDPIGYGENRPAQQGANEAAWAANRRVELVKK